MVSGKVYKTFAGHNNNKFNRYRKLKFYLSESVDKATKSLYLKHMKKTIEDKEFLENIRLLQNQEKEENKNRIYREFIMFSVCVLALIYTSEIQKADSVMNNIKIAFLAIDLPIETVVKIVPTVIMLVYILIYTSVEKLISVRRNIKIYTFNYNENFPKQESLLSTEKKLRIKNVCLPGGVSYPHELELNLKGFGAITKSITMVSLALIYSLGPFFVSIYTFIGAYSIEGEWLKIWNSICIIVMLVYNLSIIFGYKKEMALEMYKINNPFLPH